MRRNQKLVRAIVGVTPVILVGAMTRTASAASPVFPFEPFPSSYTDGTLTNQGNWVRAGSKATTTAINVSSSANLVNPFSQMPASTGKGVLFTGNGTQNGMTDRDPFGAGQTTGTVYYSFLLDVTALTGADTTGDFFISLNNTPSGSQTGNPSVVPASIGARIDPTDNTKYDLGIFGDRESLADPNWSSAFGVGTGTSNTHLIVASYQINGTGANTSSIWIDPDASTLGLTAPAATLTTTGGTAQTSIGSILLRQSAAPFLTLDELRVGTSWAAVTPTLTQYFDVNGSTAGSGIVASTTYNWENASGFWNNLSDGTGTAGAWAGSTYTAAFSAGTDGNVAYTVNISAASESCGAVLVTTGSPTITGNALNISTGNVVVAAGASIQFNNALNAATNFSVLSGSGTTFGGTVVLNSTASYTGATIINNATLQIGTGSTTGSIPVSSVITDSGTIAFNRSGTLTQGTDFDGTSTGISGTGNIVQMSSGTLVLSAATNTYSGLTTASAGTIQITNSLAAQKSTIDTTGAGTIDFGSLSAITVGGLSGGNNYSSSAPSVAITLDGAVRSSSFGGAITGSGTSLTVKLPMANGVPSIYQSLYGANTYTGGTTISSGMLQFNTLTSMPATGTVSALKGGVLSVRAGGAGEWTNDSTPSTPGALGALIAGVGGQGNPVTWTAGSTLGISTLNSGGSFTYAGNIAGFHSGAGSTDEVGLRKTGSDTTLTLTGTGNTFSGPISVDNDGGVLALPTVLPNAGQSFADYGQTVPTLTIGTAAGTHTDGSQDTGIKILTNNALPGNLLIDFGSSVNGTDTPSSLLQLYDAFAATGQPAGTSFTQTIRGITGGGGRVKVGLGTLTINVPTAAESYSYTGTVRTDNNGSTHGTIIKDGPGEQDIISDTSNYSGDFWLKNGTLGLKDGQNLGNGTMNAFIISGGTLKDLGSAGFTFQALNFQLGGVFTVDLNGGNNLVTNSSAKVTLTSDSTINVIGGTGSAVFSFAANITDNGNNFGITKTGPGVYTMGARNDGTLNSYGGDTNIQEGELRIVAGQQIGNGTSNVNLQGGTLAYNGTADPSSGITTIAITNPVNVTTDASINYDSTSQNVTDTSDANGIVFAFSNLSYSGTSNNKLTFGNLNTQATSTVTYRPRLTGSGFTYGGPIEVDNGATGTHPTVLEFGNTSGTQTFNGNFSGTGAISRLTGGTTALGGSLVAVARVSVANSSVLQMAHSANNNHVMKTPAVSIGASGSQLDLTNNKLIVTTPGSVGAWNSTSSTYSGTSGQIRAGMGTLAGGIPQWDGSGLITSETLAGPTHNLTTLAVAAASDVGKTSFGGQSVASTDTLVMYTWNGDANLDGKINADDYFQIDSHYNATTDAAKSFHNGDFNYDGQINGDDYALIDAAFAGQTGTIANGPTGGLAGVSAVPEPASIMGLVVMGAAAGLRRRRKAR